MFIRRRGMRRAAEPAETGVLFGVNLAGYEFGSDYTDTGGGSYSPVAANRVDYHCGIHNQKIVRVPIKWERAQPQMYGPLDGGYMGQVDATIERITGYGAIALLDLHNYMRRKMDPTVAGISLDVQGKGLPIGWSLNGTVATTPWLGEGAILKPSHLADLWSKLAARYLTNPLVHFDLMNEPHNATAPSGEVVRWVSEIYLPVILAIRATSSTVPIHVEGVGYASLRRFADNDNQQQAAFRDLFRTAGVGEIVMHMHHYLDKQGSGNTGTYPNPDLRASWNDPEVYGLAQATPTHIRKVTTFLRTAGPNDTPIKALIGELGVIDPTVDARTGVSPITGDAYSGSMSATGDDNWLEATLLHMQANRDVWGLPGGITYWAGAMFDAAYFAMLTPVVSDQSTRDPALWDADAQTQHPAQWRRRDWLALRNAW